MNAALQLLADRAQYITGASGAAIALREGEKMTCRASSGASAPAIGAHLDINAGLSGECVRSRMLLCCDDAENDSRVDRESCRELGIAAVLVLPLLKGESVVGLFELLSERSHAFRDRDITALERLGDMVHTALEHAQIDVAKPAAYLAPVNHPSLSSQTPMSENLILPAAPTSETGTVALIEAAPARERKQPSKLSERGNVQSCEGCGFPVSGRRRFCLDCETSRGDARSAPVLLAQLEAAANPQPGWLWSNRYLLGTVLLMAVLSLLVLLFAR